MASNLLDKKLDYWENQLLDLGKRNKMINYRETKRTTIKLVEPSFDELFDRLVLNEEELTFQRPVDRETDIRVFSILSLLENLSASLPVTIGDIKTEGSILERQKTLKNLRSKSRLALEEQGTNILYLSFGFIEWKDGKGASAQWIKSPLILVPVSLLLEALNSPYTLKRYEDDIVVNPTLEYYLKTEYGIELPQFDMDKDTPDDYLKSLEEIADQRGWRILREVSLGLLSFLKISMYNDLLRNKERIKKNPVIRAMAGDAEEANEIPEHLQSFDLDSISPQDCYQVMSADSSQQDAILYSKNNISFVMQGPPGTGKSQTITNIIAEALADGKKVLFVSEKMAALQVVYRRLQEAHLGDFCLPLHSYKANKKEILAQIGANLDLKQTRVVDAAINNLEELSMIRQELNQYANELHKITPELNISCYEAYSKLEAVNDAPTVTYTLVNPLGVSQAKLQSYLNVLQKYFLALKRLDYFIKNNPWDGLSARTVGYGYPEKMTAALQKLQECLAMLLQLLDSVMESKTLSSVLHYEDIPGFAEMLQESELLSDLPEEWISRVNTTCGITVASEMQKLSNELSELQSSIADVFRDTIYTYQYNAWKEDLISIVNTFADVPSLVESEVDYYIRESARLLETHTEMRRCLAGSYDGFTKINQLLGTEYPLNAQNQQIVSDLLLLLQSDVVVPTHWFTDSLKEKRALIMEAKSRAEVLQNCKERILQEWELEVFSLDYASMLYRFKTEYTGVFKSFNGQYRQDKKQIQALSRMVIKKLSDETALQLLSDLKDYYEKESWFVDQDVALNRTLSIYYTGLNSDWDQILRAVETAENVLQLTEGDPSFKIQILFSSDRREQVEQLDTLLSDVMDDYLTSKNIAFESQLSVIFDAENFNAENTIHILDLFIEKLKGLIEQKNLIKPYLQNDDMSIGNIYDGIEKINLCEKVKRQIQTLSVNCKQELDFLYTGADTDWSAVITLLEKVAEFKQSPWFGMLVPICSASSERKKEIAYIAQQLKNVWQAGSSFYIWLNDQFAAQSRFGVITIAELAENTENRIKNIHLLEPWIDYQEIKEDCIKTDLCDFIYKLEEKEVFTEDVERIFLKGFYRMWIGAVCDKAAAIRRFRRNVQDENVRKFADLDSRQLLIAQMRIREKLIENLPSSNRMLKATDELAILNKELNKKRNIMPLRKLFHSIPNLLMRLKPCLMMSPLSVSYFLETEAYHFDLVIFDEASQIFPEDAVGAIFRGSQVIIAGDSKQLPPTNFFASSTNNLDGDYDTDDEDDYNYNDIVSDSILEESAAVLPNRTLLWHYRSKHENLIAFSNREIYNNSLLTFPNSINRAPDMGVEYVYVENGYYDRGGRKCNIGEAEACVRLVVEHIKKYPNRSLGIIAFSENQQAAIENAIIDFRERTPEFEWFFNDAKEEPFFVKNLENVQGDERDTIIFSICYAKDKNGKMYMNFGPLGHEGGERRLNVAVTRAKCNIKLVGSILPSDIDLNRAKSKGAQMLRSYIEYAIKGTSTLKPLTDSESFEIVDEFCGLVAAFLEEHGYQIEKQVGCSDYRIDIAVVNPDYEGEYLAGIECDGLSYIRAKTARDRDHLRKKILENMGWNLYRVWSTEWSRNPQAEGEALLNFIQSAYERRKATAEPEVKQSNEDEAAVSMEIIAEETVRAADKTSQQNPYGFAYYQEANWWDADYSNQVSSRSRLSEIIDYVVRVEQPIHIELLYKRVGPSITSGKVTEPVRKEIKHAIARYLKDRIVIDEDQFVRTLPLTTPEVRIPEPGSIPRPMEQIHTEEVAMAMIGIVKQTFGITEEELQTTCIRAFGFERKGPKIKVKIAAAMQYLADNNLIRVINGKVQLTGEAL